MLIVIKLILAFILSFILSTIIIRKGIPKLTPEKKKDATEETAKVKAEIKLPGSSEGAPLFDIKSTGFWIGFFETLLIFILVYKNEFSALAIIFAAKEFVRKEKIIENASYYLLGTFVNVGLAVLFAVLSQIDFSLIFGTIK